MEYTKEIVGILVRVIFWDEHLLTSGWQKKDVDKRQRMFPFLINKYRQTL